LSVIIDLESVNLLGVEEHDWVVHVLYNFSYSVIL